MSPGWSWVRASCAGTSHLRRGERRQDAVLCGTIEVNPSVFFSVVCDGAGSSSHGGQGAALCARVFARNFCAAVQNGIILPDKHTVLDWQDEARDLLFSSAKKRGLARNAFACTLIFAANDGREACCFKIGDGAAAFRDESSKEWSVPIWPDNGEYASTTSFVTDGPVPISKYIRYERPVDAICMFTDGLEALALNFKDQRAFVPFFDGMLAPLISSSETGHVQALSQALARFLGSERVNSRTDDDKTLMLAIRR